MIDARARLSGAVDRWRAHEAQAMVDRWERPADASSCADVARAHRWLASDESRELVATLPVQPAEPADQESGALAAHVARAHAEAALADLRDTLAARRTTEVDVRDHRVPITDVLRELLAHSDRGRRETLVAAALPAAAATAALVADARHDADSRAAAVLVGAPPRPDRGPTPDELATEARAMLAETADPARELLEWATGGVSDPSFHDVLHALHCAPGGDVLRARERLRRLGALLAPSGLERELSRSVHVHAHRALDLRARLAVTLSPTGVRLGLPTQSDGLLGELAVADGVGRSLALVLAAPALPPALRRPLDASVSRSVGALLARLATTAPVLRATFDLSLRDTESLARRASLGALLDLRWHAGVLLARRGPSESDGDVLRDALVGARVPDEIATLVVRGPAAHAARFRGRRGALALQVALREKLDVDWHRNPRLGDALRALCERGGGISIESALAEMGADVTKTALVGAGEVSGG